MPTKMRTLGVRGKNLVTKRARSVVPADFAIAGLIGRFERKFDKAFAVGSPQEARDIFGDQLFPAFYGWDGLNGFFSNLAGVYATLYIASHVGWTGSAIDAVAASSMINDRDVGTPLPTLKAEAAYQGEKEYGVSGNRTGYTLTLGARFETKLKAIVSAGAYTAQLDSVAGIRVGDLVHFDGAAYDEYHKITAIDESTSFVTWTDAVWGATAGAIADAVKVMGFRLRTWRKGLTGIVSEVESELGRVYCTLEPEVTEFYAPNVHASNRWLKWTDQASTNTPTLDTWPNDVATVAYLTLGADGTAPTTNAHWARTLLKFDNLPVRIMGNVETTLEAVNKDGELYCKARSDDAGAAGGPIWVYNIPSNQTKAQLQIVGSSYQRSDRVHGVIAAHWLKSADPFASSPLASAREVPNVGDIMGLWIRTISQRGIHQVPCLRDTPLLGRLGVVGDQFPEDKDRTDLAEYGINLIHELTGAGIVLRNLFTPSTDRDESFSNGLLMREYIKASAVESLQTSENTPNSINRIMEDGSAIQRFMHDLWERGSNGSVREGETFGQSSVDGEPTAEEDHYEVVANETNNPQSSINAGQRNLQVYFTFPTPAGSIEIGVGLLIRS
jgi:hypothetical protein